MSKGITPAISDRICKHMNDDHDDELVLYVKAFGNYPEVESAKMLSIDPQGMNFSAQIQGETVPVRVEFDHALKDAKDAHHTLVEMVKQARKMQTQSV